MPFIKKYSIVLSLALIVTVLSLSVGGIVSAAIQGGTIIGTPVDVQPDKGRSETADFPPIHPAKIGNAVYLHNGEFVYSHEGFSIPGNGPDLSVFHTYRSQRNINGRWGFGWFFNYDIRLKTLENGNVLIVEADGRKNEYVKTDTAYTPPKGIFDTLVKNQDSSFTRTLVSGIRQDFDINGALSRITDRNGNTLTFTYETGGKFPVMGVSDFFVGQSTGLIARDYRLLTVTDANSRVLRFTYDANGRLSKITDPFDNETTYTYDDNNHLVRIMDDAGNAFTFAYDAAHNLISATNPKSVVFLTNTYDAEDRIATHVYKDQSYTLSYDSDNHQASVTRPGDIVDTYVMNACCNQPVKITRDAGGLNQVFEFTYDETTSNLLTRKDPRGHTTTYTYNSNGKMLTRKDALNNITTYTYETGFGFVESITDPTNKTTTFTYDDRGNLIRITDAVGNETRYAYSDKGNIVTITDALDHSTSLTYTDLGFIQTVRYPLDYIYNITTDDRGNILTITDPASRTMTYTYDYKNRLTHIQDSLGNLTKLAYDKNGNLTSITYPDNSDVVFGYDNYDRLVSLTDELDNVTSYTYADIGKVSTITDAEQNTVEYAYDALGRRVSVTDGADHVTTYTYDLNGNILSLKDPKDQTTQYVYDELNQVERITYADGSHEEFYYDAFGKMISKVDRKSKTLIYGYDDLHRLISITYPIGSTSSVSYAYDAMGRLMSASNGWTATYTYDAAGRMVQSTQDGKTLKYEYNSVNSVTKLTYPDDSYLAFEYDNIHRLRRLRDASAQILAEYTYDAGNRTTLRTLLNQIQTVTGYDPAGNATHITHKHAGSGLTVSDYIYGYDKAGNIEALTTLDGATSYTLDGAYRLTGADYYDGFSFGDAAYVYDAAGNRSSVTIGASPPVSYETDAINAYTKVGSTSFIHDLNGNLTNDGTNVYTYDDENRLVTITTPTDTITLAYDALGRCISKSDVTGTTKYIYDGNRVVAEYDGSDAFQRRFVYGGKSDIPLAMVTAAGVSYYYTSDAIGSVTEITDSGNTIVERYAYDVFGRTYLFDSLGNPLIQSEIGNPYLFSGKRYEAGAGLYIFGNRFYSPNWGRFMQPSTMMYETNSYTYADNNPLKTSDEGRIIPRNIGAVVSDPLRLMKHARILPDSYFMMKSIVSLPEKPNPAIEW